MGEPSHAVGWPHGHGHILALIPARSGSKGIEHKNIRLFRGVPLLAHSIRHARESRLVTRTIVSTDSAEYAQVARAYGAEVPFLRPAELAGNLSTDLDVFQHALEWLCREERYEPDICVHLRPTSPTRRVGDIDAIVQLLLDTPSLDSVRSIAPTPHTPFKMWFRDAAGMLTPAMQSDVPEAYNLPRQSLPAVYMQNACVDAVRTRVILERRSMTGVRIYGYPMERFEDIDTQLEFERAAVWSEGQS